MTARPSTFLTGTMLGFAMAAAIAQSIPAPSAPASNTANAASPQQTRAAETIAAVAAAAQAAGVALRDLEWTDGARQRAVPVRVYLPAAAQSAGPATAKLPLVVFSHGLGGSRLGYAHFGLHFAQHGFIALHVQHTGSDRAVWQGGPLAILGNVQEAASEANVLGRAKDVSFALDRLLADQAIGPLIDRDAIAAAGHSFGANTAMLLAGAAVERDGKRVVVADARIKAAILLSAPPFHGEGDQAAILRGVRIPTLHITGTDDLIRVPGYRSDAADRIGVFRDMPAASASPKYLAIYEGGEHSVFTDRTRSARALAIKASARELSLAFLQASLRNQPGALSTALAAAKPLLVTPEQLMARHFEAQVQSTSY